MKDSGVSWIGEIPSNWSLKKLKIIADNITDFVASGSFASLRENVEYLDQPDHAMLVRTVDLSKKVNKEKVYVSKESYDFLRNSNLFGGEIILPNIGSVGDVYYYKPLYEKSTLAPNSILVRMNSSNNNKFYYYYFSSSAGETSLLNLGSNAVQNKFNKTQLRQLQVPVPPLDLQEKIVEYLDLKVNIINEIKTSTKQSIEELRRYRHSIITETVTKGVISNVEMKDSGIEVIGKINSTYNIIPLGFLGHLQNGISKSGDYFGEGYPFVSYGDVYNNRVLPNSVKGLVKSAEEEQELYSVRKGDIFFTRTSEIIEEVGMASVCLSNIEQATFAGFLIRFRPNENNQLTSKYARYYLEASFIRDFFAKEMNLVTRASLSQPLLKKLPIILPSVNEQKEIVSYLDKQTNRIDKLISDKEKVIKELEQYKKTLIYEYVTGKKEV